MDHAAVLSDAFGRVRQIVHRTLDGLGADDLVHRVEDKGNTIAWLIWHLSRIQDDHVAEVAGQEQVWTQQGWADRFGLPFAASATGYAHSRDEVGQVVATGELLAGYSDAVHERTIAYLTSLSAADLDRVVDTHYDPPVTLGVRLISVVSDDLQHAGQAAFIAGLL